MNFAQIKHKAAAIISAVAVAIAPSLFVVPAQAVTNYVVTIVSTGGATEGANWTYANGQITPTASVSINASDIVAKLALGDLVLNGDKILVNAGINSSTASNLTFKSTGNIVVGGALTLQTQGGDIVFNSDSDANQSGHVRLGWDANCGMGYVNTNGGSFIVGGGANPATDFTYAQNSDLPATGCPGGTPPLSGLGIYNYTVNAGGGNISLRGSSPNLGTSLSVRAIALSSSGGLTDAFQTTGTGTISIYGDGSQITQNNAWGIATGAVNYTTGSGNITIEGKGNPSGPTNARGMSIGASNVTSTSGNVVIRDTTSGALAGYVGINLGGVVTVNTGGTFALQADEIQAGAALTLTAASASIGSYNTSSFTNAVTLGAVNASGVGSLSIGSPGNTSAVTLGGAVTSGGPIAVTGGAIAVNAAMTATNAPITFTASTSVTQSAAITASSLDLRGTATYNPSAYTVTGGSAQIAYYASFDSQGGSAVSTGTYAANGQLALPAAPSKAGFVFRGWFLAASGGDPLQSPYSPATNADMTLYAQWSPAVAPKDYPEVQQIDVAQPAVEGKPIFITLAGDQLNLPVTVEASNGTAAVIAQTAKSLAIRITGATAGKGSLVIKSATRTLQLADLYRVTAAKPVVTVPVYKEADIAFDARSVKLTASDIAAIRAGVAGAKVVGEVTVAAWIVAVKPTAADRATAKARAAAVAAVITKALPGIKVSVSTIPAPRLWTANGVVTYSFTAKP